MGAGAKEVEAGAKEAKAGAKEVEAGAKGVGVVAKEVETAPRGCLQAGGTNAMGSWGGA